MYACRRRGSGIYGQMTLSARRRLPAESLLFSPIPVYLAKAITGHSGNSHARHTLAFALVRTPYTLCKDARVDSCAIARANHAPFRSSSSLTHPEYLRRSYHSMLTAQRSAAVDTSIPPSFEIKERTIMHGTSHHAFMAASKR